MQVASTEVGQAQTTADGAARGGARGRSIPELDDPGGAIETGRVLVGGTGAEPRRPGRGVGARSRCGPTSCSGGGAKLEAAIAGFGVPVDGRIALDSGAAAGGFTTVLLDHGAARVYAVDAGYGQLRGELRQNPRVVDLERTNLGDLTPALVPDAVELVTLDLSYLSLSAARSRARAGAARARRRSGRAGEAHVRARARRPPSPKPAEELDAAVTAARRGVEDAGGVVLADQESPTPARRGAVEFLLHARRASEQCTRSGSG